jgi:4-hydroxy-4-methyl-2-oxoglutarate aldolase
MHPTRAVSPELLKNLQQFDSCTISNAIERFDVRTRNEGFVNGSVRCVFPELGSRIGYAVTARIRTSSTPIGGRCYYDHADWWAYVHSMPAPRFIVVQDVDDAPGLGALYGGIHANISKALNCVAFLTNGAVRDLPEILEAGMQSFAGNIAVSHAYAHIVQFGDVVDIGGLRINPGDLLHGDRHGVVCVPFSIAEDLPKVAAETLEREKELLDLCRSPAFSMDKLADMFQRTRDWTTK